MPVIDTHSHAIPESIANGFRNEPARYRARIENRDGQDWVVHDQGYGYPLFEEFISPQKKLAEMDRKGIDISVVSPAPPLFYYWADEALAVSMATRVNDAIAEYCAAAPDRLKPMATLPMAYPAAAIAEAERVTRQYGMRGVEIGTSIEAVSLADEQFHGVLGKLAELGVWILVHPYYVGDKAGLADYYLTNLVGNPLETVLFAARMMYGGVLDAIPDLKVCLAHGGGYLPYQIGRFIHGYEVRPEPKGRGASSPRALFERFYFDTITFEPKALGFLIDLAGADRVVLGTDAPFDMADDNPVKTVQAIEGLSDHNRLAILGNGAAARFIS